MHITMLTAKELTYSYFLNKSSDFQPLSHIADIVSGIYTHSSQVLVFEDVQTTMTSELEFDIEFTTYQDGDDPELESINSGRHLSTIELHNSLR